MSPNRLFYSVNYENIRPEKSIDWEKCFLCQSEKKEKLLIPSLNTKGDPNDSYKSLSARLIEFNVLKRVPFQLDINQLNSGAGLCALLQQNKAIWHKNCFAACNTRNLSRERDRVKKTKRIFGDVEEKENFPSPIKTRRTSKLCIFCSHSDSSSGPLVRLCSEEECNFVLESTKKLSDETLLQKLENGADFVFGDCLMHQSCFIEFRNRVREHDVMMAKKEKEAVQRQYDEALTSIINYMLTIKDQSPDAAPAFRMTAISQKYADNLQKMGLYYDGHTTRLKERILAACPKLESCGSQGKEILLTFKNDMDVAIRRLSSDSEEDPKTESLFGTASIIRQDILDHRASLNDRGLQNSQKSSPYYLKLLLKMILNGGKPQSTHEEPNDLVVTALCQIISFNTRVKKQNMGIRLHRRESETPFPMYTALKIYSCTRQKQLVQNYHEAGMSVSYDRLQTVLTDIANRNIDHFQQEGVVYPRCLKKGFFTTSNVDNFDHNTSSTTARDALHGTLISLTQHPDVNCHEVTFDSLPLSGTGQKLKKMPQKFACPKPCDVNLKQAKFPAKPAPYAPPSGRDELPKEEVEWLERVCSGDEINWESHHAGKDQNAAKVKSVTGALPFFKQHAATTKMMSHSMKVVVKATNYLNPGQVAVLVVDQPLYAICKLLQQLFPDKFGEGKLFVMMGGLHIEMCFLHVLGQWIQGSGLVSLLAQAEVFTEGRAEANVKGSHITRARYMHQVTAAVLYCLEKDAYDTCGDCGSFEQWRNERRSFPQFFYWDTLLRIQLVLFQFVRSQRTADYSLYKNTCALMIPWFFALDHTNYARWMSVHYRDLISLDQSHPELAKKFQEGTFVGRNSTRPFSAMALDQIHEQLNAKLKSSSGVIGLTENSDSLLKWMLTSSEVADAIDSFEKAFGLETTSQYEHHHSDTQAHRNRFRRDVLALKKQFVDVGNPFLYNGEELFNIVSGDTIGKAAVLDLMSAERKGKSQWEAFRTERLEEERLPVTHKISQNNFSLMRTVTPKKTKMNSKVASLKNDCTLFSKLWLSAQVRKINMEEFFQHENEVFPPSLSVGGELRSCDKSEIVPCMVALGSSTTSETQPTVDMEVLDGAAVVNMISPEAAHKNFEDYIDSFVAHVESRIKRVSRADVVFDVYKKDSVKNGTREKRANGSDSRTIVALKTKLPSNWRNFMRKSENKTELFQLIAQRLVVHDWQGKLLVVTHGSRCLANDTVTSGTVLESLSPCNHEEADTRLFVHAQSGVAFGYSSIKIRTVDSDVVVLAVFVASRMEDVNLWVDYGTQNNRQYIAAHEIARTLGPEKSCALPVLHAFSGCDTVSSFGGVGKKTAWDAWQARPESSSALIEVSVGRIAEALPTIEKLVVRMYSKTSSVPLVNTQRSEMFRNGRMLPQIPPTQDALVLHMLRTAYQSRIWHQTLSLQMSIPAADEWGWERVDERWRPVWRTLPEASRACRQLIFCGCKTECAKQRGCSCRKTGETGLQCTPLCTCSCQSRDT